MDVGVKVGGNGLTQAWCGLGQNAAGTSERVGQAFAHVSDDQLQRGQAIEQAGNDKAQSVEARFGVPTPARDGEQVAELAGKAGEVGLADRLGRWCRVKVYGNLKLSGSLKDG